MNKNCYWAIQDVISPIRNIKIIFFAPDIIRPAVSVKIMQVNEQLNADKM